MNSVVRNIKMAPESNSEEFRDAMRNLAGGVSVLTVGRGADISGMTVTSVSSLSIEPPTLIVSANRQSSSWPKLKRYGSFGVSILSGEQVDVAERFAGKNGVSGVNRFTGAQWMTAATGVPLLVGALATFDCEVEDIVERHSHAIIIGRVLKLNNSERKAALAYWQGQYVILYPEETAASASVNLPTARALWQI